MWKGGGKGLWQGVEKGRKGLERPEKGLGKEMNKGETEISVNLVLLRLLRLLLLFLPAGEVRIKG